MSRELSPRGSELERPQSPVEHLINSGFMDELGNLTDEAKLAIRRTEQSIRLRSFGGLSYEKIWNETYTPYGGLTFEWGIVFHDNSALSTIAEQWQREIEEAEGEVSRLPARYGVRRFSSLGAGAISGAVAAGYMTSGNLLPTLFAGVTGAAGAIVADEQLRPGHVKSPKKWIFNQIDAIRGLTSSNELSRIDKNNVLPSVTPRVYFWKPIDSHYSKVLGEKEDFKTEYQVFSHFIEEEYIVADETWEHLRDLLQAREQAKQDVLKIGEKVAAARKRVDMGAGSSKDRQLLDVVDNSSGNSEVEPVSGDEEYRDEDIISRLSRAFVSRFRQEGQPRKQKSKSNHTSNPFEEVDQKYQQAWIDFIDAIAPSYHRNRAQHEQLALMDQWGSAAEGIVMTDEKEIAAPYLNVCRSELLHAMSRLEPCQERKELVQRASEFIDAMPEMLDENADVYRLYASLYRQYGRGLCMPSPNEFKAKYPAIDQGIL